MDFTIRKMKSEDITQLQNVAKTTWNATYDGIIPLEVQENFLKTAYNDEAMKQRLEGSILPQYTFVFSKYRCFSPVFITLC